MEVDRDNSTNVVSTYVDTRGLGNPVSAFTSNKSP